MNLILKKIRMNQVMIMLHKYKYVKLVNIL